MKKSLIFIAKFFIFLLLIYCVLGVMNSYFGWYGYKKWKNRKHSTTIEESIKRGVFIGKLHYRIDSFYGHIFPFEPFIEKGFTWGYTSSNKTVPLINSRFPFQLSYNYRPDSLIGILIGDNQFVKFDSSTFYLEKPILRDTITLIIEGENIKSGIIKVWQ